MDIRTILLAQFLVALATALGMLVMQGLRITATGVGDWTLGVTLIAGCLGLMGLRGMIPAVVSVALAHTLLALGFVFLWRGVRSLSDRPPLPLLVWALPLLLCAHQAWFTVVQPCLWARYVAVGLVCAILAGGAARELRLPVAGHGPCRARRAAGLVLVLYVTVYLGWVVLGILGTTSNDFLTQGTPVVVLLLVGMATFPLLAFAFALTVTEKLQADMRTLEGLLPICSYCRRVRDDEGSWNEIESYVRTHAGTQFSHGVCPTCYEQHARDLGDEDETATCSPSGEC